MITEKQLKERMHYLGASDIPVLMGLSRFKTPYDLWLEKTGRVEPVDVSDNPAVAAGIHFEDGVLRFAEERLGSIVKNRERRIENTPIKVHTDAVLKETGEPIEAKVEGLFSPLRSGWGDDGTDEVPFDVLVQSLVQMAACGTETGYVVAFLGGRGFRLYRIKNDNDVKQMILQRAVQFWTENVMADKPPVDSAPTIEFLKNRKRYKEPQIELPEELAADYLAAKEAVKVAEERLNSAKEKILMALGDYESGQAGAWRVLYPEYSRKGIDIKRLQAEHPEIAEKYEKKSTYRVLYVK
ncbi:MAG TPA: YqaJ viral recombinase family protein [Anaerohalosphaeraceae bacterium]|nr:YqaJ viral recombinase family protein [Anaerohalosphaeraceae bacterium]HQI08499.1 YqaJ viral recombinase family protein [Anaerohalosphaeraceae bacterium]HQJ68943.1 YqaJ viral recombinase family protein [Anaerohalosphaeraceae bacterium]